MSAHTKFEKPLRLRTKLFNKFHVGVVVAVVVIASAAVILAVSRNTRHGSVASKASASLPTDESAPLIVKFSADKLRSAQLHMVTCQRHQLEDTRTFPGKISYNEALHLVVKSPVEGVVRHVSASPQQMVKKGEVLTTLTSREVGLIRDEISQCRARLALAQKEAARADEIAANLADLLDLLKQHPDPKTVEKAFKEKGLGEHREQVIGAYSKLFLTEAAAAQTDQLKQIGGISGRLAEQRQSNREVANAAFETACEESRFETSQARDQTRAEAEHAARLLAVSCQRLEALAGNCSEGTTSAEPELSGLACRAPFDGVVEERLAVTGAHVTPGQALFALANTDIMWVCAEVPERDWRTLNNNSQRELVVRVPSMPDSEAVAHVKFTEGNVSPETHTVAIVGELDNGKKQFRPGMFVWVSMPVGHPRQALAVPASAIVNHEQSKLVFIADGSDTFHVVNVTTGIETPGWVEVTGGLKGGETVVDQGTFVLKSELLLEREAE